MSCEWIFKSDFSDEYNACPKCGMGHYGARYVYGDSAYRYSKTQAPWKRKKLAAFDWKLEKEIQSSNATDVGQSPSDPIVGGGE